MDLSENIVGHRIRRVCDKLKTFKKSISFNWNHIVALLNQPFDLSEETPKKRKTCMNTTQDAELTPPPKVIVLKSDCEKCPAYRAQIASLIFEKKEELLELANKHKLEISNIKKELGAKKINRTNAANVVAKNKLRDEKKVLKSDNKLLMKDITKLKSEIVSKPTSNTDQKTIVSLEKELLKKGKKLWDISEQFTKYKKKTEEELDHLDFSYSLAEEAIHENTDIIPTKEGKHFNASVRLCLHQCLQAGMSCDKTSETIRFIAKNLCGVRLGDMPSPSTVYQCAYEAGVISDIQVGEALYFAERATLGWDATPLGGNHFNEVHVCTRAPGATVIQQLTMQTAELAGGKILQ